MLHWAVKCGDVGWVREWLHSKEECTKEGCERALLLASSVGNVETVQALIGWRGAGDEEWCDPRQNDHAALLFAARAGRADILQALLDWRGPGNEWCDPRAIDNVVIGWARVSRIGAAEAGAVVRALLEWRGPCGERCDVDRMRRVHRSARERHKRAISELCDYEQKVRREWNPVRVAWISAVIWR